MQDIINPYFGDTEFNADAWVSYRTKILNDVDWTVQLNARNLIGGSSDDIIPVAIDPLGRLNTVRTPVERQFLLTNTFRF